MSFINGNKTKEYDIFADERDFNTNKKKESFQIFYSPTENFEIIPSSLAFDIILPLSLTQITKIYFFIKI